jgi:hypothetical protein
LQYGSERLGIGAQRLLRVIRLDVVDAVLASFVDDDASARGDDVAVPVHVLAVGQLRDKTFRRLDEDDGRLVRAP